MMSKQKLIDQLRQNFPSLSDECLEEKADLIGQLEIKARSGDLNDQLDYALTLKDADLVEAIPVLRELAEKGSPLAQYHLGMAYAEEILLDKNPDQYFEWVAKAADAGIEDAQREMAFIYLDGETVPKNVQKAIYWLEKTCEHGDPFHICELAELYTTEGNGPEDYEKAFNLYQSQAERGYERAFVGLAIAYFNGYGVSQDMRKAAEMFAKANMEGIAINIYQKLEDIDSVNAMIEKLAQRCDTHTKPNAAI